MDEDGDAVFLCPDPLVVSARINKPIVIDMEDKASANALCYTRKNLTDYEMMTRDSRIGEITNAATSLENKIYHRREYKKTLRRLCLPPASLPGKGDRLSEDGVRLA